MFLLKYHIKQGSIFMFEIKCRKIRFSVLNDPVGHQFAKKQKGTILILVNFCLFLEGWTLLEQN